MTDILVPTKQKPMKRRNTREKLLNAALALIAEDRVGLSGLSLREITRRIGVSPSAFYRHFPGMEELGLTLIRESCATLRSHLGQMNTEGELQDQVHNTVQVFIGVVMAQRDIFVMITREQAGGSQKMRLAISHEIELIEQQLVQFWSQGELLDVPKELLQRVVSMGISLGLAILPAMLDLSKKSDKGFNDLVAELEQQLELLLLGAAALSGSVNSNY